MSLTQLPFNMLDPTAGGLSLRNKIINGCGWIDQRNGNSPVTINSTANTFGPDRWAGFGQNTDGVFLLQGTKGVWDTSGKGFPSCIFAQTTTADTSIGAAQTYGIRYAVEGQDIAHWRIGTAQAATVTLSFRAYSTKAGTHCVALTNSANTRSYVATFTINAASTWEQKSITIALDQTGTWLNDNGAGLKIFWNMGAGSSYNAPAANSWQAGAYYAVAGCQNVIDTLNAILAITDVQLEQGSAATPFEQRPYGVELALCQRYFQSLGGRSATEFAGNGWASAAASGIVMIPLKTSMRPTANANQAPTVTMSAVSDWALTSASASAVVSSFTYGYSSPDHLELDIVASGSPAWTTNNSLLMRANSSTNARLKIDAEL